MWWCSLTMEFNSIACASAYIREEQKFQLLRKTEKQFFVLHIQVQAPLTLFTMILITTLEQLMMQIQYGNNVFLIWGAFSNWENS